MTEKETREILLEQMRILQEQTKRMIKANSATPAAGIAALSHAVANIGKVMLESSAAEVRKHEG